MSQQYSILDLHKGKALVICGPRAIGKTLLVNTLTSDHQTVFCCMNAIAGKFNSILADSPEVLVIDEFRKDDDLNVIKHLVADETCEVHLKHKDSQIVKTPKHIVICTDLPPEHFHLADQRRFVTLSIQGGE